MKMKMQEHIEFKDRWFKGGKTNMHKHTLPNRGQVAHQHDISFQVSSATEAHTHLESRIFNIAILPQTPDAPKLSLGASLHMTVSWVGRPVVSIWRRHADGFEGVSCFCIWQMAGSERRHWGQQQPALMSHFSLTWKRNLKFQSERKVTWNPPQPPIHYFCPFYSIQMVTVVGRSFRVV